MDRAQVRVLEEADQVGLGGLLQGKDGSPLETQVGLELLCDLANQALERELPDQKFRALLVSADLAQSYRARPVPVGLLYAAGGRSRLPGRLCGELLAGSFASC